MTANGRRTGTRNRVIANDHGRTGGGRKGASTLVETASGHSESTSEPDGPVSSLKTMTGTAETARGQKGSVKSASESARVHKTAKGSWSESATRETEHATQLTASRFDVTLPVTLCHLTGRSRKSESGSGPRKRPQPLESPIVDRAPPRQRSRPREGQSEQAQMTPEREGSATPTHEREEAAELHSSPEAKTLRRARGGRGDTTRVNEGDALRLLRTPTPS